METLQEVKKNQSVELEQEFKKATALKAENEELERKTSALQMKLDRQSDYESIKKDLSILKALEFSSGSSSETNYNMGADGYNR